MLASLPSSAVPQADRIERVLEYAVLLHYRQFALRDLLYRGRDAMYYRSGARILGLIDTAGQPSERLVESIEQGQDPIEMLRACFERSAVGVDWARWSKTKLWQVDPQTAERFLEACTELSPETIERRAKTLRAWFEELVPEDTGPSIEELRGLLLARPLSSFPLSTRTTNIFRRRGFTVVLEPVRLGSKGLLWLQGFGQTGLRELDGLVHSEPPGESLDELCAAVAEGACLWPADFDPSDPKTGEEAAGEGPEGEPRELGWDELASKLPDHILALPIVQLDPPTRMLTHCTRESIETIGPLVAVPEWTLRSARGLGPTTLTRTQARIIELWRRFPTPESLEAGASADPEDAFDPRGYGDVLDLWKARLARFDERDSQALLRRSGALRESETLEQIGVAFGVTRERIRQLEKRGLERLANDTIWIAPIRNHLDALRGDATYLWLSDLEREPFLRPLVDRPAFTQYLFNRAIPDDWHAYTWDDELLLTHKRGREPEALYTKLTKALRRQAWPAPYATFLGLVDGLLGADEADLRPLLIERAEANLALDDPQRPSEVLQFGQARAGRILTYMAGLEGPVSVQEIVRIFGRGALPTACIMVRRGHVALPRHFPDFELWERRLAPLCRRTIEREGPDRQWMAHDLLELAGEESRLPEWITPWLLTSMLRRDGTLDDLGRQRFALHGSSPQARIQLLPTAIQILEQAGGPMPETELHARLLEQVQVLDSTFALMRTSLPLFVSGEGLVGLVERDLPGGIDAVQAAGEQLEHVLGARGRGLTFHEALTVLRELGPEYASWDQHAVHVVPRARPALAANRAGIGLDAWDEVRVPSRVELLRELLDEGEGVARVDDFTARIVRRHGQTPTRTTIGGIANLGGARMRGDYIVIAELADEFVAPTPSVPAVEPEPEPEPTPLESSPAPEPAAQPAAPAQPPPADQPKPRAEAAKPSEPLGPPPPPMLLGHPDAAPLPPHFPGARDLRLPRAARLLYTKLAQERPGDWDAVLRRGAAHAARFEAATDKNEFLPVAEARELTRRMPELVARARASEEPSAERLAWVCARYFEIADDGELDFAIGGLDDDVALFNAVARRLGFDDLTFELS